MAIRSLTLSSLFIVTILFKKTTYIVQLQCMLSVLINYNSPNLTVSLAIITSSFVGITITLTGECG